MKTKYIISAIVSFIFMWNTSAQDIISVGDAKAKIKADKKSVVMVSCQKASDYKKKHITNAVHINHKALYKDGPIKSLIKTPAELAKILGKKGVVDGKTIILYDDGKGKYSGRIYWILKYMGAADVKILDGHIKAWIAGRGRTTMANTMAKKGTFTPNVQKNYLANISEVKAAQNHANKIIVDVRSAEEFNGTKESKLRKGHIPSAINLEFKQVIGERAKIKSREQLEELFSNKGIARDKEVILYCESSVRAGIVFMTLTSILDYKNVKVYDGAFNEWQADNENKVVK